MKASNQHIVIVLLALFFCSLPSLLFAIQQSLHVEWSYTTVEELTPTGFRLYREGQQVCETEDPYSTALDCLVEVSTEPVEFTLAVVFTDGSESLHSAPYTFEFGTGILAAHVQAEPLLGEVPLTVSFDGSGSAGSASSYAWSFGDGSTATGPTIDHSYVTAGNYTATLIIADDLGATDQAVTIINVSEAGGTDNAPPTAVISASTTVGPTPLATDFDGSQSNDSDGVVVDWDWDFGDGATANGEHSAHIYLTAGTFDVRLTVADDRGATGNAITPVIATPVEEPNTAPSAHIALSTAQGLLPLQVNFSAASSTDSDGSITSFTWNFGDGSSATDKSVNHTYIAAAEYTVQLEVTDNLGATGTATAVVVVESPAMPPGFPMELGEVVLGHEWVHIDLQEPFIKPIVITGPPSATDSDPCLVRMRDVTPTGFDIRLQEWDYQDGSHGQETVAYLVVEQGNHVLDNGLRIEAGEFAGSVKFQEIVFSQPFQVVPVVMTSSVTFNEADAIANRQRQTTADGFLARYKEQQKNRNKHTGELVHYVAWEPGIGTVGSVMYEVANGEDLFTHNWKEVSFHSEFTEFPFLFAAMQTQDGGDVAALRYRDLSRSGVHIKVEEEQSKDDEVTHTTEEVGYFLFSTLP